MAKGAAFPGRTRPLGPYPQFAAYTGSGDSEDAGKLYLQEPSVAHDRQIGKMHSMSSVCTREWLSNGKLACSPESFQLIPNALTGSETQTTWLCSPLLQVAAKRALHRSSEVAFWLEFPDR